MLFSKNCLTFTDSENSSPERAVVISLSPPHINVFFSNLLLLFIVDMLLKLITNNWLSCTNLLSSHSTWPSNAVAGNLPEHTMQRRRVEASRSSCFALQLDAQTEQSGIAAATPTTTIVPATATTTTAAISANCGIVVGVALIASKLRLPPDRSSSRNRRGEGRKGEQRRGEKREQRVGMWEADRGH